MTELTTPPTAAATAKGIAASYRSALPCAEVKYLWINPVATDERRSRGRAVIFDAVFHEVVETDRLSHLDYQAFASAIVDTPVISLNGHIDLHVHAF